MNTQYEKPVVTILPENAEGIYAASGSGSVTVTDYGVWDRWTNGGKKLFSVAWIGLEGNISLTIYFNDTVDDTETDDASVQKSISGQTVTLTFDSSASNPFNLGIHLNHGTNIYDLQMTDYHTN